MRLGPLRHKMQFQRKLMAQDPVTGAPVTAWVDAFSAYCSIEYLSVREFIQSAAGQSEITARIKTRYRDDIKSTMRAVYQGRIYNIHGVLPDNKSGREYITLPVSEGVNDG